MTATEFLQQAAAVDRVIESKIEQVEKLKTLLTKGTSVLTGMPRSGNGREHYDENRFCKEIVFRRRLVRNGCDA